MAQEENALSPISPRAERTNWISGFPRLSRCYSGDSLLSHFAQNTERMGMAGSYEVSLRTKRGGESSHQQAHLWTLAINLSAPCRHCPQCSRCKHPMHLCRWHPDLSGQIDSAGLGEGARTWHFSFRREGGREVEHVPTIPASQSTASQKRGRWLWHSVWLCRVGEKYAALKHLF